MELDMNARNDLSQRDPELTARLKIKLLSTTALLIAVVVASSVRTQRGDAQTNRPQGKAASTEKDKATVAGQHAIIGNSQENTETRTRHDDALWFPHAGLGLFLHWGISSVEGKNISWPMMAMIHDGAVTDPAEQTRMIRERKYGNRTIVPTDYWAYAERFNPTEYHPEIWLRKAKDAGFQYVVLTAKHHEGFALWPSAFGQFNT